MAKDLLKKALQSFERGPSTRSLLRNPALNPRLAEERYLQALRKLPAENAVKFKPFLMLSCAMFREGFDIDIFLEDCSYTEKEQGNVTLFIKNHHPRKGQVVGFRVRGIKKIVP